MQHLFRELSVYGFIRENYGDVNFLDDIKQLMITWVYQQFIIGQKIRIINLQNPKCAKYNGYEGYIFATMNKKQRWGITIDFGDQGEQKFLHIKSHNLLPVQSQAQLNNPSKMTYTPKWKSLPAYEDGDEDGEFSSPLKINPRNFAILPAQNDGGSNWCYRWSKSKQKWRKWVKYPSAYYINPQTASFTVNYHNEMTSLHVMDLSNR